MKRSRFSLIAALAVLLVSVYAVCYLLMNGFFSFDNATGKTEDPEFALLREAHRKNPDVYAWLRVDGTRVSYPLLQHSSDNRFYLYHDAERNLSSYGAIFTESYNRQDFSDPFTVVYGHAMRDGAMFGALHDFQKRDFFDQHSQIKVWLLDGSKRIYQVVSAHVSSDEHIFSQYDLRDGGKVKNYYALLKENVLAQHGFYRDIPRLIDKNGKTENDTAKNTGLSMLALSTCEGDLGNKRLLVQAVVEKIVRK